VTQIVIKLFGGKILETDEAQGRLVARAVTSNPRPQFVMVDGNSIAIAEITGVYTREKFDAIEHGEVKLPDPIPAAPQASERKVTPWKAEQFDELKRRFAERMTLSLEKRGPSLVWIETEPEFRAVMAGEQPWPVMALGVRATPGSEFGWIRKLVTGRQFETLYAGRPGYWVLEKAGSDVVVGFKRPVNGWHQGMQLPPGEAWCDEAEIARLEAAVQAGQGRGVGLTDEFYGPEATAARREVNRVKYMPAWKRELEAKQRQAQERIDGRN
jgi:hypothetical protein